MHQVRPTTKVHPPKHASPPPGSVSMLRLASYRNLRGCQKSPTPLGRPLLQHVTAQSFYPLASLASPKLGSLPVNVAKAWKVAEAPSLSLKDCSNHNDRF